MRLSVKKIYILNSSGRHNDLSRVTAWRLPGPHKADYSKIPHLPRRSFLFGTTALVSNFMVSTSLAPIVVAASAAAAPPMKGPKLNSDTANISLKMFMDISRFFTENSNLKGEVGEKIFKNLQTSPLHQKNLAQINRLLKMSSLSPVKSPTEFSQSHHTLQKTIQELLTAWYVGYGNTGNKPVLFNYYDSLMYQAVAGVQNIPATCGGELNFWAHRPDV